MAAIFKTIKPKKISDQVFEQLKDLVYRGELAPGEKLMPERELGAALGVSRSSIREAIHKLVNLGLLVQRQGQGTFVATADERETNPVASLLKSQEATIVDLLEVRIGMECNAAAMAATKGTPEEIDRIARSIEKMRTAIQEGNMGTHEDATFHMAIAYATGNPIQIYIMKHLYDFIFHGIDESLREFFNQPHHTEEILAQHEAVERAIRQRDPDGAHDAMKRHINYIIDYFRKAPPKR